MASDFLRKVHDIGGTKAVNETALPTEDNGMYHDIAIKTTDSDGTLRSGDGMYGTMQNMYGELEAIREASLVVEGLDTAVVELPSRSAAYAEFDEVTGTITFGMPNPIDGKSVDILGSVQYVTDLPAGPFIDGDSYIVQYVEGNGIPADPNENDVFSGHLWKWDGDDKNETGDPETGVFVDLGKFTAESSYDIAVRNGYDGTELEWTTVLEDIPQLTADAETAAITTTADTVTTAADVATTAANVTTTTDNAALTNADVVSTNADVVLTNADVVTTGDNVAITNADVVTTADNVTLTNADVVTTGNNVTITASNVGLTNDDVIEANATKDLIIGMYGNATALSDAVTAAETAETAAALSEANAATSADASATSATESATSETNSGISAAASSSSATASFNSENTAEQHKFNSEANKLNSKEYSSALEDTRVIIYTSAGDGTYTEVESADYSALHHAYKSAASATASAASASASSTSAANAASSETNVTDAVVTVAASAAAALASETTAAAEAAAALASSSAATTSATNSSISATAADTSLNNAILHEYTAEALKRTADSYATEAVDTNVRIWSSNGDGTYSSVATAEYSALHYATKAIISNAAITQATEAAAEADVSAAASAASEAASTISAGVSEVKAAESAASAASAVISANASSASSATASTSETNASISANSAQLIEWECEAEKKTANSYASQPVDESVKKWTSNGNGTYNSVATTDYSALHWSTKASSVAIQVTTATDAATNASTSAAEALVSKNAASASETAAAASASTSSTQAAAASASASTATIAAASTSNAADDAQEQVWHSTSAQKNSDSYATQAEDDLVKIWTSNGDGTYSSTNSTEFSALHYAAKAAANAALIQGDVSAADTSAAAALASQVSAKLSEDVAEQRAWSAHAERLTANSYANQVGDVPVQIYYSNGDGTYRHEDTSPQQFSARHYAEKVTTAGYVPEVHIFITNNSIGNGPRDFSVPNTSGSTAGRVAHVEVNGSDVPNDEFTTSVDGTLTFLYDIALNSSVEITI